MSPGCPTGWCVDIDRVVASYLTQWEDITMARPDNLVGISQLSVLYTDGRFFRICHS